MRWMLEAAGVSARGIRGELRTRGLVAVWLWTVRAWQGDETSDLSETMAALDTALGRAEQVGGWMSGGSRPRAEPAEEAHGAGEIEQGEAPEPESPPPPDVPPSAPIPPMPPTSLPPEPLA